MPADAMSPVPAPGLGSGRMTWAGRLSAADPRLGRLRLGMLGTVTAAAALGAAALLADALLPWATTSRRLAEAAAIAASPRHRWHDLIADAGEAPPDGDAGALAEGQRVLNSSASALADALGSGAQAAGLDVRDDSRVPQARAEPRQDQAKPPSRATTKEEQHHAHQEIHYR